MWRDLLENASYTSVDARDAADDRDEDLLIVVSKLAFRFDSSGRLKVVARPVRKDDVPDGAGGMRYPSDFSLPFRGTECAVVGTAHPSRAPAESKVVSFAIGSVEKSVRLFGPRVYMKTPAGVRPGPSANVVSTPLRFEHCWGGHAGADHVAENPVGKGFASDPTRLVGTEAHRLEPVSPLLHASAGCFAPIDASWAPRCDLAGTFDESWRRERAPGAPADRDDSYHSSVRPEQRSRAPLTLPLPIRLRGFGGDDEADLLVPAYGIHVVSELHRGTGEAHDAPLTRVIVDVDARVVELAFVAHVPLPMKWAKLRAVRVLARGSLPDEVKPGPTSTYARENSL
ncbi:MAG: DUF2169 domain-containing protein [Polyangiaceae bacterium]